MADTDHLRVLKGRVDTFLCFVPLGRFERVKNGWVIVSVILTPLVLVLLALFVVLLPTSPFRPAAYAVLSVPALFLQPGLLLLPFVWLLSFCYLPFGRKLAQGTPFLRATTEAAPPGLWHLFQIPTCRYCRSSSCSTASSMRTRRSGSSSPAGWFVVNSSP